MDYDYKKIIDGKRYDTTKATLIGTSSGGEGKRDFKWWEGGLFVTKSARYFLAGEGGPMSRWARRDGSGYSSGSGIIPLDKADALEWAEQHLTVDQVEQFFGDVVEEA